MSLSVLEAVVAARDRGLRAISGTTVWEVAEPLAGLGLQVGDILLYRPENPERPLTFERALPPAALQTVPLAALEPLNENAAMLVCVAACPASPSRALRLVPARPRRGGKRNRRGSPPTRPPANGRGPRAGPP